jgi:Rhs element Vgr protein
MAAPSPIIANSDIVSYEITSEGSEIPGTYQVISIEVDKQVNQITKAAITLLDGSAATENFPVSDSSTFVPGNKIEIKAGYKNNNTTIFKGIILKQSIQVEDGEGAKLIVECQDTAVKMTVGRKSEYYTKMKDSDAMKKAIGNSSGVSSKVTVTNIKLPELVQYYSTDWDFVLARAEVNGMVVLTDNNTVTVQPPDENKSPVLSLTYGDSIMSFNGTLDSTLQLSEVKANAWDFKTQKMIAAQASNTNAGPGNLSSKKLSEVIGLKDYELETSGALEQENLTNWAKAQMVKSTYSKIRGGVKFQGSSLVNPGNYVTIDGMGDRFNGDNFVGGVRHEIKEGNWFTTVELGLSPEWMTSNSDVMSPPASGLLPGTEGLLNGTVKKIYDDPDSQYRILVDVPVIDQSGDGIWARLSNFYSTSGAGAFFLPEVGDEVVLGFLNQDPRYPIILGSMYSSPKNKPTNGLNPNEKNSKKAIVTKGQLKMEFDDENKILTMITPGKNQIEFNDKSKTITIKDQNSNSVKMSDSGIDLTSPKSINIRADESVTISGTTGVTIDSSGGEAALSGMSTKITADTQLSINGGMSSTISASAELSLQAGMIMIN